MRFQKVRLFYKYFVKMFEKVTTTITGKMLGGSGSHNGMVHSRGSPRDYDNWANILNDDSFNYTNVLKYFRRMETFVGDKIGTEGDGII